ncbi:unnamed protein product [Periconia digitata]|uniref:Uncharacterized protein n=1 Tax=Periconia digitata TaxID=1303443 RepID=A0A9W4UA11_9PLEO|nr:unnamed protein product [Periconia digitata]
MTATDALKGEIMAKLAQDPLSITTEDARRFSETYVAKDDSSAKIISAVGTVAVAAQDIHEQVPTMGQEPKTSLLTIVNDLKAAVENNPDDVNNEILKITQSIVSKMQRAVGQVKAPHPELEGELQAEYAKIEPKVEQGTVTKAEADHLHSLEARAHGHTEKGGLTAAAQSVSARRNGNSNGVKFTEKTGLTATAQALAADDDQVQAKFIKLGFDDKC